MKMWKKGLVMLVLMAILMNMAYAQIISPTTGLPIEGEPVAPMLVVISNSESNVEYNGHTTSAQGVGKRQAWGGQKADIIYECPLYRDSCTRLTYLFHDALVNGETVQAGPIRSVRSIHVQLTQAWNGGLIYANGLSGNLRGVPQLEEIQDVAFTDGEALTKPHITSIPKVRVPDHRSADVVAIHSLLADQQFKADALVFTDELPGNDLPKVTEIKLNWGTEKRFFSRFVYDEDKQTYQWYSNKVPKKNWTDASRTEETELNFANVIVQYVPISHPVTRLVAETDLSTGGRAQIAMGGRMVEARWVNRNGRIHYVDDNGNDVPLQRGKTYVAIWADDWDQLSYKH